MAKKMMTKPQTVATLAEQAGISKKAMAEILDNLVQLAYKEAKNGRICGAGSRQAGDDTGKAYGRVV